MTERRHPNVINADEVEPRLLEKGRHQLRLRQLATPAGNQQLGATLTEIPPGKLSFPAHYHFSNEESVYILSGTGTARIGDARVPVRAGDWIAYPVGPAHAHQLINDGDVPLVYLCRSTAHRCEIVGYPDSQKIGMVARETRDKELHRQVVRASDSVDYWDGEPEAR
jgi:uncharacterized cupin superfamily protein